MLVVHSPLCLLHDPPTEILSGKPVPYKESPDRLVRVRDALSNDPHRKYELTAVDDGLDILPDVLRVHSEDYVVYLRRAYSDWVEEGGDKQGVLPESFPHPKLPPHKLDPANMSAIARAGYYCFDLSCPITEDTFEAIMASARVAVRAAQQLVDDTPSAAAPRGIFALTRPPGHHAGTGLCGGYCYLNNAAIAVRCLQDAVPGGTAKPRVAILDIDYHHGNGSQEIFYCDDSVFYVSLHAEGDYPYFTGSSVEEGEGPGVGFNLNLPLPQHTTGDDEYLATLNLAGKAISDYSPDYLVSWRRYVQGRSNLLLQPYIQTNCTLSLVCYGSLGVDTYKDDPICCFNLTTPCYSRIGARIRDLGLPTLFLFEGGYCMETLGANVKGVLDGFIGS